MSVSLKAGDIFALAVQSKMCLLVSWNVKAAVNWHHAQIFDWVLTLCEKATVWYLEGRVKKITFSVVAAWRNLARGLHSHVWLMSGQQRSLLVSTTGAPCRDSDRTRLAGRSHGHLDGATRHRCHSQPFECHRPSERLLLAISNHTHGGGKSELDSVYDVM